MQRDIAPLLYLEARQSVNRLRRLLHSPSRASVYLLAIGYFIFMGFLRRQASAAGVFPQIPEPYASTLFFAFITLVGIMMYGGASGIVGAFASPADARFLIGSRLSPRVVVLWLQLRRCGVAVIRMLFTILLYALLFSRPGTYAGIGFAVIGGTLLAAASPILALKMRATLGTLTAQGAAGAIAAIGILPLIVLLSAIPQDAATAHAAIGIEHWGAGRAFNALWSGQPAALLVLYGCALVLIAAGYAAGDDLYPDLYSASLRVIAFRAGHRGGRTVLITETEYRRRFRNELTLGGFLSGAWAIAWKEWIGFMRSSSLQRAALFGFAACAIVGATLGHIARQSKDPLDDAAMFISVVTPMIVIALAMGSAIALSADIAKPLWWMGSAPLWQRLLAWIIGTSWRLAVCLSAGAFAFGTALHLPGLALLGAPMAITFVLTLRAVGLALYAIFPSSLDQRGPLAMLRALITFALSAPPGIVSTAAVLLLHSLLAGILLGTVCALAEAMLLIAFAALRIEGQGVSFATAEGA